MKYYGELGLEFKSGILFSGIALVLSILAGLIGSVPFGMIIFRSLIIIPLFFFVGFGLFIIVKSFIPEVYDAILNFNRTDEYDSDENTEMSSDEGIEGENLEEEGFKELTENDYDKVQSTKKDNVIDTSGGKLGKHIIVNSKSNPAFGYEPKIMAEAIRTMMSKDED
jgi:hypothetical protein